MSHNPMFPIFLAFIALMWLISFLSNMGRKPQRQKTYARLEPAPALPVRKVQSVKPVEKLVYPVTLNTAITYDESYVDITRTHYRIIIPENEKLYSGAKFTAQDRGFCILAFKLLGMDGRKTTIPECIDLLTRRGATIQEIAMLPDALLNGKQTYKCKVNFYHPPHCKLQRAR